MSEEGWEEGVRVRITDPRGALYARAEAVDARRRGMTAWPSEEDARFYLECISREEAARISSEAREQFFYWLAGAGLNPADILYRWTMASGRLLAGTRIDGEVMEMMEGRSRWERYVVARVFPGPERVKATLARSRYEMERVAGLLRKFWEDGRYVVMRDDRSIRDLIEWVSVECLESASEEAMEESRMVATHSMEMLCRWIAQDGAGLLAICQRIYGLAFERYSLVAPGMTGNDFAALLGQVRATFCEMTKRFFEKPLEIQLGYVPKVTGQKSAESSEVYRENAAKHCPKRQLSGDAGLDDGERRAVNAGLEEEQARRVEQARKAARARDVERDAMEFQEFVRRQKATRTQRQEQTKNR